MTSRGDLRKKLEYAFQLYDTDNNGTLNNAEVSAVVGGMLDMLGKGSLLICSHNSMLQIYLIMPKIFSTIGAEKKNLDMTKLIAECVHGLDKSKDGKIDKSTHLFKLLHKC